MSKNEAHGGHEPPKTAREIQMGDLLAKELARPRDVWLPESLSGQGEFSKWRKKIGQDQRLNLWALLLEHGTGPKNRLVIWQQPVKQPTSLRSSEGQAGDSWWNTPTPLAAQHASCRSITVRDTSQRRSSCTDSLVLCHSRTILGGETMERTSTKDSVPIIYLTACKPSTRTMLNYKLP